MKHAVPDETTIEHYSIPRLAMITDESEAVWRKRVLLRKIRYIKCGRNVRISRAELDRWLQCRTVHPEAYGVTPSSAGLIATGQSGRGPASDADGNLSDNI